MGLLDDALPYADQPRREYGPAIKSQIGMHPADFIGVGDPYQVQDDRKKCGLCGGNGTGIKGEPGQCRGCGGNGKLTLNKCKLQYRLLNGVVEEEEVTRSLAAGGGQTRDGTVKSPTTLFIRFRDLSDIKSPTPQALNQWYSTLRQPVCVPCHLVIGKNQAGTALKIISVQLRDPHAHIAIAPAPSVQQGTVPHAEQTEEEAEIAAAVALIRARKAGTAASQQGSNGTAPARVPVGASKPSYDESEIPF